MRTRRAEATNKLTRADERPCKQRYHQHVTNVGLTFSPAVLTGCMDMVLRRRKKAPETPKNPLFNRFQMEYEENIFTFIG
jgi:hypothetical protein